MDKAGSKGRVLKNYLIGGAAALLFWLASAALDSAFYEPSDFISFILPRGSGELWMRLLLSIIVGLCAINQLDRDARIQELEKQVRDVQGRLRDY